MTTIQERNRVVMHLWQAFFVTLCIAVRLDLSASQPTPQQQLQPIPVCTDCSSACSITNEYCGCDADCEIYKDCCQGWRDCINSRQPTVPGSSYPPFQCHDVSIFAFNPEYYWMVSECPADWPDIEVESNCVCDRNDREFPPVTEVTTGFVYRNEFCAACNGVVDVSVWGYDLSCDHELQVLIEQNDSFVVNEDVLIQYCTPVRFRIPSVNRQPQSGTLPVRECFPSTSGCLPLDQVQNRTNITMTEYNEFQTRCNEDVVQQLVFGNELFPLRNQYCALCNALDVYCFQIASGVVDTVAPPFPFSATLDIFGTGQIIVRSEVITTNITVTCPQSQVYDPFTEMCRQTLLCDSGSIGGCSESECINGSLLNLTRSVDEFTYLKNSSAILYNGEVFEVLFNTSDGDPVICVDFGDTGIEEANITINFYSYPEAYFILTYIGCSLSVIGTTLVLITYAIFKELRTLPSKILMNLAVAILIANLLILLGGPIVAAFPDVVDLCVTSGVLLHFFFLSQFSWMSIMSLEMTRIFYQASRLKTQSSRRRKDMILLLYVFVGWGVPLLITTITIIVNYTKDGLVLYGVLPDGSRGSCWINHIESAVVAFVTPLAVSLIFNCITFTIVSILLCKASYSQAKLDKENNISYFRVNIAVFSTTGLTWIFGFLAILAGTSWTWYLFIVLNSTQGFFIFIAFLFTKRVASLYIDLLTCKRGKVPVTSHTKPSAIPLKSTDMSKASSVAELADVNYNAM